MVTIQGNPARSVLSALRRYRPAAALVTALSLTLLVQGSGAGKTYYVSPMGSDSNACTQARPCAKPDYVFNKKASAGDTVRVAPGTYDYGTDAAAQFLKSGTAVNYITVTCATRGACKIQNSITGNRTVVVLGGSYITFDGFEVTNNSSAGNNLGLYVTGSFVNITHNTIHHIETDCSENGGGGIQLAGSGRQSGTGHHIVIDSNRIYDISWTSCQNSSSRQTDGILAETAGGGITITNNIVYHVAGGWGIMMGNGRGSAAPMVVQYNTVFSNGNGGITLVGGTVPPIITNNIVLNNGLINPRCGINLPHGLSGTVGHNDLWNNAGGNYCVEWGSSDQRVHADDISVDPALGTTFINWQADGSGDYRLKADSLKMGAGSRD
ncbi:right-handed parallel beta-helix repeat-containing protein [Edaphobacter bradus]|uniref:right-handed parallel beta-helix repeat-containing protein n=1 Tax=Edaphobacter bradus TaxID=2259016 RepID=UPI0021E03893|nr:right-handed parallel beta-helix repeat-containing protein [Edaphobacter bradus]